MPAVGQSPILEASPSQARSCSWTDGSATGQEIRKDLHFRVSCGCGNKGWPRRAGVGGAGIRERARAGQAGTDSVYHFLPFQGSELWPLASGHTAFLKPEEQGSEGRGSGGVVLRGVALRAWPRSTCPVSLSQPPGNSVLILGSCFLQLPAMYMSQVL